MIQIFADDVTNASRSAILFIRSIKKECDLKGVKCVISEMIDVTSPFIIAEPNSLPDVQEEVLRSISDVKKNDVESHVDIASVSMNRLNQIHDKALINGEKTPVHVAVFGGSGNVATKLSQLIKESGRFNLVANVNSKTITHDAMTAVKKSDIIISAIPFDKQLVIDIYGKIILDLSNSLSHSAFKSREYVSYKDIGGDLTSKIVDKAAEMYKEKVIKLALGEENDI